MFSAAPTYFTAIIAGLLSFLSPCVLPLVPAYLGYLSGHTIQSTGK
ncbi:MAG: cytochrome c biogenesis protein CcdA [Anaerolineales bacterium]|nr:MAG: cytochrome c biogenesis protein CcdA [Anaerolineales bacterium]WKZ42287.1 MAG: cytochrome c biogenesis protein CcdA [Anaerolineales bacterium]